MVGLSGSGRRGLRYCRWPAVSEVDRLGGEATRFTRRSQATSVSEAALQAALASALRAKVKRSRWYQGKGLSLGSLRLLDRIHVPAAPGAAVAIIAADHDQDEAQLYALAVRADAHGDVCEAGADDPLWQALAELALTGASIEGEHGALEGLAEAGVPAPAPSGQACRALETDQSNTSYVLDERVVLKLYRRLRPGTHPELELLHGLTRVGSTRAPALYGSIGYRRYGSPAVALATAYAYVEGIAVGWECAIAGLAGALTGPAAELEQLAVETSELGTCVGDLHCDLLAAFGSRTATRADARVAKERAEATLAEAVAAVASSAPELPGFEPPSRAQLSRSALIEGKTLQRIHGDLHVGQLLYTPAGVVALDFEGDPTLPTEDRRRSASPLVDVAGLLLSLDHVAVAAARRHGFGAFTRKALAWSRAARAAVLAAYEEAGPPGPAPDLALLRALEVEREWREARYAADVLPEWLYAPRLILPELVT